MEIHLIAAEHHLPYGITLPANCYVVFVGQLRPDILHAGSDQFGRSSAATNVERCISAVILAT